MSDQRLASGAEGGGPDKIADPGASPEQLPGTPEPGIAPPEVDPDPGVVEVPVGIGRRVVVLANLGLSADPTAPSLQAASGGADALASWQGPGTVVLAGNLLDLRQQAADQDVSDQHANGEANGRHATAPSIDPAGLARRALEAHVRLSDSLRSFAGGPDRRLICLPGSIDSEIADDPGVRKAVERLGGEVMESVDLLCETAAGTRRVKVLAGEAPSSPEVPTEIEEPWQGGMDRLADSTASARLVRSRTVYRWLSRHAWWFAVPFVVVLLLSLPVTSSVVGHLFPSHPGPVKALHKVEDSHIRARI